MSQDFEMHSDFDENGINRNISDTSIVIGTNS